MVGEEGHINHMRSRFVNFVFTIPHKAKSGQALEKKIIDWRMRGEAVAGVWWVDKETRLD